MIPIAKSVRQEYDPDTGELTKNVIQFDIGHTKTRYSKNRWCKLNQDAGGEHVKKSHGLFTVKGKVFYYLVGIMEYGNFAPFNGVEIAKAIGVTKQAVYKAKKELIEESYLTEGVNTRNRMKGVILDHEVVEKGEDDAIVTLEQWKAMEE